MYLSVPESVLTRPRCRQWTPLITQQLRLRHVHQIIGFNLSLDKKGSFYYTLHLTTMSAPFYTSEQKPGPNPKWKELDMKDLMNTFTASIVLRIWQHIPEGSDSVLVSWGVNFSGLVYLGNKVTDILPEFFKQYTVIFLMHGGFFTSHLSLKCDLHRAPPFKDNLNLVDTLKDKKLFRRIAVRVPSTEVQNSYNIDKLRNLHFLQVTIKNKSRDVQMLVDKINGRDVFIKKEDSLANSSSPTSIRYAPQLLTMNSLNKLLQEKPTKLQKQEMLKIKKEIEIAKFRSKLLYQERDKKLVSVRKLKYKQMVLTEENEERESTLMENYYVLSKDAEKIKDFSKSLMQHREFLQHLNLQLNHRRHQLMEKLLFIYPIEKCDENKYTIRSMYLPNSDVLADCSDAGLAVALGYVTHVLVMCSSFLQVPLRYPLTHCGSRSYIADCVSSLLSDRETDFPLYVRSKDKMHFPYAVYLLNKNIAQLRWLYNMQTIDLKATLPNLLSFLRRQKDDSRESLIRRPVEYRINATAEKPTSTGCFGFLEDKKSLSTTNLSVTNDKFVSLHSFGSNSNISDPILDIIRHENQIKRSSSPTGKSAGKKTSSKVCRGREHGPGLSEILAIPEAFLNKQITSDSFKNYMTIERSKFAIDAACSDDGVDSVRSTNSLCKSYHNGTEANCDISCNNYSHSNMRSSEIIEQGKDPLDPSENLFTPTKSISIKSKGQSWRSSRNNKDCEIKPNRRLSRSVGSYTDDESCLNSRPNFKVGSEPFLNISSEQAVDNSTQEVILPASWEDGQKHHLENWLRCASIPFCTDKDLYPDEILGAESVSTQNNPLTMRTDALLNTKSFNLIRPRQ